MVAANPTLATQSAVDRPCASAPDILSTLEWAGPLGSKTAILELC